MEQQLHLEGISSVAQRIQALVASHNIPPCPGSLPQTQSFPQLYLPFPEDFLTEIKAFKLSSTILDQLAAMLRGAIQELQQLHRQNYEKACRRIMKMPQPISSLSTSDLLLKLCRAHEASYQKRYVPSIKSQILDIYARQRPLKHPRKKHPFNNEYIPLLETYFEHNAYPSGPDRLVLARKSMMTPRQIEVWFQNHRTRTKKEGRSLKRMSCDPIPLQLSLATLEQKMPFFTNPEVKRCISPDSSISEEELPDDDIGNSSLPATTDFLGNCAPPHAFPTTYPPNITYDPFPYGKGVSKFPEPVWFRRPSSTASPTQTIDFDELVSLFAQKLNLRETSSKKMQKTKPTVAHRPWFAATVTAVPSAPHPAFVHSITHASPLAHTTAQPLADRPLNICAPEKPGSSSWCGFQPDNPMPLRVTKRRPKTSPLELVERSSSPTCSVRSLASSRSSSFSSIPSSSNPTTPTSSPPTQPITLEWQSHPQTIPFTSKAPLHSSSNALTSFLKHSALFSEHVFNKLAPMSLPLLDSYFIPGFDS